MPDYVAILKRSISALPNSEPALRQAVYDRARAALSRQLTSVQPPLSNAEIEAHHRGLEDAIGTVEAAHPAASPKPAPRDPDMLQRAETALADRDGEQPDLVDEPVGHIQTFPPRAHEKSLAAATRRADEGRMGLPPADTSTLPPPAAPPRPARSEPSSGRSEPPAVEPAPPARRRSWGGIAAALVGVLVLVGLGAAVWVYRDALPTSMAALGELVGASPSPRSTPPTPVTAVEPSTPAARKNEDRLGEVAAAPGTPAAVPSPTPPVPAPDAAPTTPPAPAPAPAATPPAGGTDVATAPATPTPAPAPPGGPLVAQRAFYLELGGNGAASSSTTGQIAWTQVDRDSAAPAIRGVLEIPERKVTATILISKNEDEKLPASHLIEISFSGAGALSATAIERVPALVMKPSEQARGQPLTGAAIPVTEKVYWIALSDEQGQAAKNVALLKDNAWFDMPILFKDGKRALLVFEKGVPGDKVFNDVISTWNS